MTQHNKEALDDVRFIRKELGLTWLNNRQREVTEDIHARLHRIESALTAEPAMADAMPRITERGFAGHFILSHRCTFRRNTLIDFGDRKIVVSTVGNLLEKDGKSRDTIGINRHYETMAFEAVLQKGYWEADIGKQLSFKSPWSISELEHESDAKADLMHDAVVNEIAATYPQLFKEE